MVRLEKISYKNVWKILHLKVREEQADFVATNTESIVEAYLALAGGGTALPFAVYDDDTPVGFLMIGYGALDWEDAPGIAYDNYCIWRLMIDERFQGRGFGRQALELALEYVKTAPCGKAEYCWLSYEPENVNAKALYRSMGFEETGEMDGDEIIAAKRI